MKTLPILMPNEVEFLKRLGIFDLVEVKTFANKVYGKSNELQHEIDEALHASY